MAQDTVVDQSAHAAGPPKGEALRKSAAQRLTRKADDATGINVADRKPISTKMPNLPPA